MNKHSKCIITDADAVARGWDSLAATPACGICADSGLDGTCDVDPSEYERNEICDDCVEFWQSPTVGMGSERL